MLRTVIIRRGRLPDKGWKEGIDVRESWAEELAGLGGRWRVGVLGWGEGEFGIQHRFPALATECMNRDRE
jgi:hypothetical protein